MKFKVLILALVLSGCATSSDIEKIQSQIRYVKSEVGITKIYVTEANVSIDDAISSSTNAILASDIATEVSIQNNKKLDLLFNSRLFK